jgi:flagella basal body P-ring formation protein FlgA
MNDSLESEVQELIMNAFPGFEKYEVNIVTSKSKENFVVNENRPVKRNGNLIYVPIDYISSKNRGAESFLTCEVKFFANILIAAKDIQKGKNLERDDFEQALIDVSKTDSYLTDISEITNHRAATFIKKSEVLRKELIEENPVLRAGDKVIAHSISGAADVQVEAIAQQDGWQDTTVRVKTRDKKLFKAKVIDRNNVLIVE